MQYLLFVKICAVWQDMYTLFMYIQIQIRAVPELFKCVTFLSLSG